MVSRGSCTVVGHSSVTGRDETQLRRRGGLRSDRPVKALNPNSPSPGYTTGLSLVTHKTENLLYIGGKVFLLRPRSR